MANLEKQVEELTRFICSEYVDFEVDEEKDKLMRISLTGTIEILHKGKLVFRTMQPFNAIEEWNKI